MLSLAIALSQSMIPTVRAEPELTDPCTALAEHAPSDEPITLEELARLADIGQSFPGGAPRPFGVSPDEKSIAFIVRRANPLANAYCQRVLIAPVDGQGKAVEIDRGGEYIRIDYTLREFASVMGGWDRPNTPEFSPDGLMVAFLKRTGGTTQVWIADRRGQKAAYRATSLTDNVDRFAWAPDGRGLVIASRPGLRVKAEEIAREAAVGFLFDERFSPQIADRPIPTGEVKTEYTFVSLSTGNSREATAQEVEILDPRRLEGAPVDAKIVAEAKNGSVAWVRARDPDLLISPTQLEVSHPDGTRRTCTRPICDGIRELWWSSDGSALLALRASGWANSGTALLRWHRMKDEPEQLVETGDTLVGCTSVGDKILCAREGSTQPRRLVAIDIENGAQRIVFDPNPDISAKRFGTVRRLKFRNAYGTESFADLVLPPGHRPGERHPLIVVQYNSEGFLRGGTGDEVPIHPLANRGFAVLSFDRPSFTPEARKARTVEELMRANRLDWTDRKNVQSSLARAIALALETGAIDAARMGISGFSDGGVTVQWALINSQLFKVASMGSCCEDMYSYPTAAGPGFARLVRSMGYKHFEPGAEDFWKPVSLMLNVDEVSVPILIQTADSEYEAGLDVMATFSHHGRPIELYIFENETHIKFQPAHRQAMYERSVDWFSFWLKHEMDCIPRKASQYERWTAMDGAPPKGQLECRKKSSAGP